MRVLFLEFDGVLHPLSATYRFLPRSPLRHEVLRLWLIRWAWVLDELLASHPEVGIVVHSNWRLFVPDEELQTVLGPLTQRFRGTTPRMPKWDSIVAVAQSNELRDYRILDASPTAFPQEVAELIICDAEAGLQDLRVQTKLASWLG